MNPTLNSYEDHKFDIIITYKCNEFGLFPSYRKFRLEFLYLMPVILKLHHIQPRSSIDEIRDKIN